MTAACHAVGILFVILCAIINYLQWINTLYKALCVVCAFKIFPVPEIIHAHKISFKLSLITLSNLLLPSGMSLYYHLPDAAANINALSMCFFCVGSWSKWSRKYMKPSSGKGLVEISLKHTRMTRYFNCNKWRNACSMCMKWYYIQFNGISQVYLFAPYFHLHITCQIAGVRIYILFIRFCNYPCKVGRCGVYRDMQWHKITYGNFFMEQVCSEYFCKNEKTYQGPGSNMAGAYIHIKIKW